MVIMWKFGIGIFKLSIRKNDRLEWSLIFCFKFRFVTIISFISICSNKNNNLVGLDVMIKDLYQLQIFWVI